MKSKPEKKLTRVKKNKTAGKSYLANDLKKAVKKNVGGLSEFVNFDVNLKDDVFHKEPVQDKKLKDFFIPHAGNRHAPHILHPKRAIFYSAFFVIIKLMVFVTIMLIPAQAYLLPDILMNQEKELIKMINDLRAQNNLPTLSVNNILEKSAQLKADDMAQNGYFSHDGPDGRDFQYFLRQAGYEYKLAGENLAMGFNSAQDVMDAWIKSPLHYQNLIDPDFIETGFGLSSGEYKKRETVFIANHFGQPTAYVKLLPFAAQTEQTPITEANVLGQKFAESSTGETVQTEVDNEQKKANVIYDKTLSNIYWSYDGKQTRLFAQAFIEGEIKSAVVAINDSLIKLTLKDEEKGLYQGEILVEKNIDDFFKVVISPSIIIEMQNGFTIIDNINWYEVKIVNKTPTQNYIDAYKILPNILKPVFKTEKAIYILGLIFFSVALLINILIEIKTQRPHVIIPTVLMISLLIILIFV